MEETAGREGKEVRLRLEFERNSVMGLELSPAKRRFLELAMRQIDGTATREERRDLDALITANPQFKQHYRDLEQELTSSKDADFWAISLRVLFSGGTADEDSLIRNYRRMHRQRWNKFLEIAFSLQALGAVPTTVDQSSPTAMPEAVRKRLLAGLKDRKKEK
jgi:hypothetical protein